MKRLVDTVVRLSKDRGFIAFQNYLIRSGYKSLTRDWQAGQPEVGIVEGLTTELKGKTYGSITVDAKMIHGNSNLVKFEMRSKEETCELGDMVVITVVTAGRERLMQRVCIVQNKKVDGRERVSVDQTQLFLLKNFPPFLNANGFLAGLTGSYRNASGCLGAYGILAKPGDMLFSSAPLLTEFLRSRESMLFRDIAATNHVVGASLNPFVSRITVVELVHWFYSLQQGFFPFYGGYVTGVPFLGNVIYCRDFCDFVKNWTQINIGEVTHLGKVTIEPELDSLANRLIALAGLGGSFDIPADESRVRGDLIGRVGVLLYHVDVE